MWSAVNSSVLAVGTVGIIRTTGHKGQHPSWQADSSQAMVGHRVMVVMLGYRAVAFIQ